MEGFNLKKTKILINHSFLTNADIEYMKKNLDEGFDIVTPEKFDDEEILKHIEDVEILLGDNIKKEMLERGNVQLIQIPFAGVERLNYELLSNYDIPVCNSHSNALCVAEYAVGLLLGISKKIPYHDKLLRNGDWNRDSRKWEEGEVSAFSSYVSNKTIGFIGYGNIGRNIGKLLQGFNPKLMAIVSDKNKEYEELDFIGDANDLDYVLENADYIIVAAALTHETRGMLNKSNLTKMKDTAYIINISRGRIIDEESLFYILENKLITGAAIDTWYNYPDGTSNITYPSNKYDFHKLDNIIISPHRAAQIVGEAPYLDDAIYNINQYRKNKEFINRLNLKKGY